MPNLTATSVFLSAALLLAITPGPGMLYVLARTLRGGYREGMASTLGTGTGGLLHVVAAAFGLSAIVATSALAFMAIKYIGAVYLVYLGLTTLLARNVTPTAAAGLSPRQHSAYLQGIMTETLNPKTALFFLAFLPQFINPAMPLISQFLVLGAIVVTLNTLADAIVVALAGPINRQLNRHPWLQRGQRVASGSTLIALGVYVAVGDTPAPGQ